MIRPHLAAFGILLSSATFLTSPTLAQSEQDMRTELAALKERIAKLEALMGSVADGLQNITPAPDRKSESQAKPPAYPIVTKLDPAPGIGTADGTFTMNMRGRLMLDWGMGKDDLGTFDYDATEIRAAWFGIEGTAWKNIGYRFEADFGSNAVSLKDAFVTVKSSGVTYTIGHSKIPMSIEWLTASTQTTFMERASFKDAFGLDRYLGVKATKNSSNWGVTAGVFKGGINNTDDKEGWTLAGRAHYGGKLDSGAWLVGVSARYRDNGDSNVRYRARPFSHLADRLVSLNGPDTDTTFMGDASLQMGSFYGTVEYAALQAHDLALDAGNASLHGGYAELGWNISGEARPLNIKNGTWGRPKVASPMDEGGLGLWQVAARYDVIDLSTEDLLGGRQETYLVGLSWYPNGFTRALLNYSHSKVDQKAGADNKADTVGLRLTFDW